MSDCPHDELIQVSTITAETIWNREPNGYHVPEEAVPKVLAEETEWFACVSCGEHIEPDVAA